MNPYEQRVTALASSLGYEFVGPYTNSQTKALFRHVDGACGGHEFSMTPNKFLGGRRCPRCAGVERYTGESYRQYIEEKTAGAWTTLGDYVNTNAEIDFACGVCGAPHRARPRIFISRSEGSHLACRCGNPLPTAASFRSALRSESRARGGRRKSTEQVQGEIDAIFGPGQYQLMEAYRGSMVPIRVLHTACGTESVKRVDAMIHHAEGCLACSGRAPISYEDAARTIGSSGTHVLVSPGIANTKTPLILKHVTSGLEYRVTYKDFVHKGHRGHHPSAAEEEIAEFVRSAGFEVRRRDRTAIAPMEIDILVASRSLGIEYNGSYYHSDRFRAKGYHAEKAALARSRGVRLIQITDGEWLEKGEIVRSKLAHLLGATRQRLDARSLAVVTIDPAEAARFFSATHIQGAPRGAFSAIALVREGGSVQACIALAGGSSLGQRGGDGVAEVVRYSTALGTSVRGGFTKLTRAVFRLHGAVRRLVTFADLMWSEGDLYVRAGWALSGRVAPRYRYVHAPSGRSYHRTSFTKDKIAEKFPTIYNPALTEREMMDKTNFVRVYDAGKLRFVLDRELVDA